MIYAARAREQWVKAMVCQKCSQLCCLLLRSNKCRSLAGKIPSRSHCSRNKVMKIVINRDVFAVGKTNLAFLRTSSLTCWNTWPWLLYTDFRNCKRKTVRTRFARPITSFLQKALSFGANWLQFCWLSSRFFRRRRLLTLNFIICDMNQQRHELDFFRNASVGNFGASGVDNYSCRNVCSGSLLGELNDEIRKTTET